MKSTLTLSVVIPTHMWASATRQSLLICREIRLSYPLTCGLLQRKKSNLELTVASCHTHSHVGFCNPKDGTEEVLKYKLSYPLTCGLLQLGKNGSKFADICCHTHSHVGFCNTLMPFVFFFLVVVIPTHMWASATRISIKINSTSGLSYPLTCGLLQLLHNYRFSCLY